MDSNHIINYLVRMVVPLRREFDRKLDVGQFMHDFEYAAEVLELARNSVDPRLREYGLYVEKLMHGARIADSKPVADTPPKARATTSSKAAAAPQADPQADPSSASEEQIRTAMAKKYISGLR